MLTETGLSKCQFKVLGNPDHILPIKKNSPEKLLKTGSLCFENSGQLPINANPLREPTGLGSYAIGQQYATELGKLFFSVQIHSEGSHKNSPDKLLKTGSLCSENSGQLPINANPLRELTGLDSYAIGWQYATELGELFFSVQIHSEGSHKNSPDKLLKTSSLCSENSGLRPINANPLREPTGLGSYAIGWQYATKLGELFFSVQIHSESSHKNSPDKLLKTGSLCSEKSSLLPINVNPLREPTGLGSYAIGWQYGTELGKLFSPVSPNPF